MTTLLRKEPLYRLAGFLGFRFGHFWIIVGVIKQGDDKIVSVAIAAAFIFSPFVNVEKHRAKIFAELGAYGSQATFKASWISVVD